MTEKRYKMKGLVQIAAKQLGNEYLNQINEARDNEEYKKIIPYYYDSLKQLVSDIRAQMGCAQLPDSEILNITFEEYEEEIYSRVVIWHAVYLAQTESYNPPEQEIKTIMKISLIQENVIGIVEQEIKSFENEYIAENTIAIISESLSEMAKRWSGSEI